MSEIKQNAIEGNIKPIGSSDFQSFLNEQLLDPIVKQEYDSLEEEYIMKRSVYAMQIARSKQALVDEGRKD